MNASSVRMTLYIIVYIYIYTKKPLSLIGPSTGGPRLPLPRP